VTEDAAARHGELGRCGIRAGRKARRHMDNERIMNSCINAEMNYKLKKTYKRSRLLFVGFRLKG
jgi:hypothetical protein